MGGFLLKLLGGGGGNPVDGIAKIIDTFHMSPEEKVQAEQAKALLAQHAAEFQAGLELQFAQLDASDRASARQRQQVVKDYVPGFLAVFVTIGFFGILGAMLKWAVPDANQKVLFTMLGALGTAWIAIVGYYFGSSAGSAAKSDLIEDLTRKSAP